MTYASVCSGIEAPGAAWGALGWRPLWFAEVGNSMAVPVVRWIGERIAMVDGGQDG